MRDLSYQAVSVYIPPEATLCTICLVAIICLLLLVVGAFSIPSSSRKNSGLFLEGARDLKYLVSTYYMFYTLNHFTHQQMRVRGRALLIQTSEALNPLTCSKHCKFWRSMDFRLGMGNWWRSTEIFTNLKKEKKKKNFQIQNAYIQHMLGESCSTSISQIIGKGHKIWNGEELWSGSKTWTSATPGLRTGIYLSRKLEIGKA